MNYADISIAVVGSGLAGSTFIAAIAAHVRDVILLDRVMPEMQHDQRPISLSYSTVTLLKNLGLWDKLSEQAGLIEQVHVSEQGRLGSLRLAAADMQFDALGYVIPFAKLQTVIYQRALEQRNVHQLIVNDIVAIDEAENVSLTVMTESGEQQVQADYLIAADGMHSRCRELLDITAKETDHNDTALTAILTIEQPHQGIAYERFTKRGTMALLPMWDRHQYRLVWTLSSEQVQALTSDELMTAVMDVFGSRIGVINGLKMTGGYPLKTILAKQQVTQRCVLLGDSAHRIYPLSAQGYNLTARDCAALVDCLLTTCELDEYAAQRKRDQRVITGFTQGLEWVFGLQLPLFDHLRATALFKTDMLPPLKRKLVNELLGRHGRMAELLCEA